MVPNYTSPNEVRLWLEWAGERLLTLQVSGTKPQSYRSFWPDYPDDPNTAYGYTGLQLRTPSPSSPDISLMDEVLNLVLLTPIILQRRVINARALVHPLNGRHLYSWTKIAKLIHSTPWTVKDLHKRGLGIIAIKVSPSVVNHVRLELGTGTDSLPGPSLFS